MLSTENGAALIGGSESGKEGRMLVKFTRNTVAARQAVKIGDEVELPEKEARFLIALGKAVEVTSPNAAKVAPEPEQIIKEKPAEPAPQKAPRKAKK